MPCLLCLLTYKYKIIYVHLLDDVYIIYELILNWTKQRTALDLKQYCCISIHANGELFRKFSLMYIIILLSDYQILS